MNALIRVAATLATGVAVLAFAAESGTSTAPFQVTPDQLDWRPFSSVPAGAQISVVYGDLKKEGPYVFRVKFPPNYRVPAHYTPDESMITVISGTLYRGIGDKFDQGKLKALPAGSFVFHTPDEKVFIATKEGEVVLQVNGRGPLAPLVYVNPADDPRKVR